MTLTTWTKDQTMLFVDFGASPTKAWKRVGKSTIFDLALNPETSTLDFIENANPYDELDKYKPTLPSELYMQDGDAGFDAFYALFESMPVGTAAIKPALLLFPKAGTPTDSVRAWSMDVTIVFTNYNSVDKFLRFELRWASDIVHGTVVVAAGVPTFTADT